MSASTELLNTLAAQHPDIADLILSLHDIQEASRLACDKSSESIKVQVRT
ncbi:hypothetical protein LMG28614_01067 [Paraburkholderia ultramafica]|uniref:Uncharacterized protein n=1 Tax=Paraburkholderia ultramafica TaxID=1544867 RepID=A0A6S7B636_9BURK|nr:hypothetical protein [Paraburkholderia ultramafica]CAB3780673.1 hypothetical protein LMG28614_01067 [Paraburkholderia ultramafica]